MDQSLPSDYEPCRQNLGALADWYDTHAATRNEATTRLQLVDRLFFDCLGWTQDDAILEESHAGHYADYTFLAPRRVLIVEAKKEGEYFELPPERSQHVEYSIQSLRRDFPPLKAAIDQATEYCQERGVPFCAVTNGHQVVAFVATRSDGVPPLDGKALVFASLRSMLDKFTYFWAALSKPGIEDKRLQLALLGDQRPQLPGRLAITLSDYPGIKGRNLSQTDLHIVSELVLEDIPRSKELETQFLQEAYCESGALSQHSLVSRAILQARYSALFDSDSPGPTTIPVASKDSLSSQLIADSFTRRPILLLGDVGVGKTMFLRHFLAVDAAALLKNSIAFYLDLGSRATLTTNLRSFILTEITTQLRQRYGIDVEERNFVRGVYDLELKRFAKGIYSDIRESHPDRFRDKEIEFLEQRISSADQHLQAVMAHISKARKQQIVIFIDNADQRDDSTQEHVFLVAQELAEHWPTLVFVTLRPETFHRSRKLGVLTGYHPKAFTIAPPRIDRVISRRLLFALKVTTGELPIPALGVATQVRLEKLGDLIRVFLMTMERSDELEECIDNMAGGNVRLALDLVRQFFGSGHVDTEKILQIYQESGSYYIPLHEFVRAIMYGDAAEYDPSRSPVANLFDITSTDPKEHFLLPMTAGLLAWGTTSAEGFVETTKVYESLQALGFTPDQIDAAIVRGHRKKLFETAARRIPEPGQTMPQALRATSVGIYHITRLARMFSYVDAMIVDTPILDTQYRRQIRDAQFIRERLERTTMFCQYLDRQWQLCERGSVFFNWKAASEDLSRDIDNIWERTRRS